LNHSLLSEYKSFRAANSESTSEKTHFCSPLRQLLVGLIFNDLYNSIEKTNLKDFEFFLKQTNFLKVVDTLEKFEQGLLDKDSPRAREFILFKRQLYAMYEVQNRSVNEHELFSFEVERKNLTWLYRANADFIQEMHRVDQVDQLADHNRLGKNEVFRRRTLNPRRLKGITAFASSYGIYTYAPYLAVYLGTTLPMLGVVCAGLYGMLAFSESQIVNSIKLIKDQSENHGRLTINVGQSAFTSKDIIVDVKDIQSIVALGDDSSGDDGNEGNVIRVRRHFDIENQRWVEEEKALTLPGDAFRDRYFLDWILADKNGESGDLADDFQDLMLLQHEITTTQGKIGSFDVLAARDTVAILNDSDAVIDA
jgi:hypothetical protein